MKPLALAALALASLVSGGCGPLHIQRAAFSPAMAPLAAPPTPN